MHDRISVSEISSWRWTLDEDLTFYRAAGIDHVGVAYRKLEAEGDPVAAAQRVVDAGVRVTNLLAPGPFELDRPESWPEQRERMGSILDTALALRPEVLVFTTGPAGQLSWERAADALDEVMRTTVAEAARESLVVAIEHTNALRTDVGFVHTLRDAIELAWRVGTGVCLEVNSCWAERNLLGTITAGIDAIALVQLSDYVIGTHTTPDRVVPGDGDIPLGRIVDELLDAGYGGVFDIEVIGPRIEDEGYESAIRRSIAAVEDLLDGTEQPYGASGVASFVDSAASDAT
jgi:sugar phosphate isomerase/epimerase